MTQMETGSTPLRMATCKLQLWPISWHHSIPWPTLFLFGLWSIWTNRNCVTYQVKQPNQHLQKDYVAKALEFHFLIASTNPSHARLAMLVQVA